MPINIHNLINLKRHGWYLVLKLYHNSYYTKGSIFPHNLTGFQYPALPKVHKYYISICTQGL